MRYSLRRFSAGYFSDYTVFHPGMTIQTRTLCLALLLGLLPTLSAQMPYTRFEAGFSVKEKTADGKLRLTMGQVYYDRNIGQLIYRVDFPEPEIRLATDSVIYRIRRDSIVERLEMPNIVQFSVINLCLSGNLPYFGLNQSPYTIGEVSRDGDLVISTWLPPAEWAEAKGRVVISQRDKQLFGMVSYAPDGTMIGRQFLRNYIAVGGLQIPTEVINYAGIPVSTQITTFRDVRINHMDDDTHYRYTLPAPR
ncbi:MAG: hypothetical protein OHK0039_04650 [Bacteroidia bacterium]